MTDSFRSPGSRLVDTVAEALAEHGPMTGEHLVSILADRGVALGGDDIEVALTESSDDESGLLTVLADDRWACLPALLSGRTFTHRLTEPEVEHDILDSTPDLDPIEELTRRAEYGLLADGAPVVGLLMPFDVDTLTERGIPREVVGDVSALLLPPGYLHERGFGAGDLIGLRLTGSGLVLEAIPDQVMPPERVAALGRRLDAVLATASDGPMELNVAVWTACADDPALFAEPLPPLRETLDACCLVHEDEWLAREGFDFRQWHAEARRMRIARQHALQDDDALAVLAIVTLYDRVADLHAAAREAYDGGDDTLAEFAAELGLTEQRPDEPGAGDGVDTPVRAILPALARSEIAEAVLAETLDAGRNAAALGLFAETLEPLAPRRARPALRWLQGKAREWLDDPAMAEADYLMAESLDPQWSPVLVDLARYASDRGDADRGLTLLRRAGAAPDHHLVELLERFRVTPRTDVGRNDPCWCGSGRKYKKCHLHCEQLPLEVRAAWLYQKAGMFLSAGRWREIVVSAAAERAQFSESPYAMLDALEDPLVTDAALFEGGVFAEFVGTRGALLPEDERLLADQWLLLDRSVYEIQQVEPGEGCTMRDVRTGDIHRVRERTASRQLKAGALVCARVVPAGDTMQIFGGIEPVELHQRDDLVTLLDSKPDPDDLVSFLSRRFAPNVLQNTEGDPLVLCEITLSTGDPHALIAELDETYERAGDGREWIDHVTTEGTERIRATLRLDGAELTVDTNSEARADHVLDVVHALDSTLTVVADSRRPARDTREAGALAARNPNGSDSADQLDPTDPELAAVLDQFVRDYERKWLDQPIPTLAGNTPRQAAADPTRRDDLVRLIDSFPSNADNPGIMSPDRLRAALDLP